MQLRASSNRYTKSTSAGTPSHAPACTSTARACRPCALQTPRGTGGTRRARQSIHAPPCNLHPGASRWPEGMYDVHAPHMTHCSVRKPGIWQPYPSHVRDTCLPNLWVGGVLEASDTGFGQRAAQAAVAIVIQLLARQAEPLQARHSVPAHTAVFNSASGICGMSSHGNAAWAPSALPVHLYSLADSAHFSELEASTIKIYEACT